MDSFPPPPSKSDTESLQHAGYTPACWELPRLTAFYINCSFKALENGREEGLVNTLLQFRQNPAAAGSAGRTRTGLKEHEEVHTHTEVFVGAWGFFPPFFFFSPQHSSHCSLFNTPALKTEVKQVPFLLHMVPGQGKFPYVQQFTVWKEVVGRTVSFLLRNLSFCRGEK